MANSMALLQKEQADDYYYVLTNIGEWGLEAMPI
jgi:hypothetical protein